MPILASFCKISKNYQFFPIKHSPVNNRSASIQILFIVYTSTFYAPFLLVFYRLMKLKKSGDFVFSLIFDFQTHEITKATSINLAAFVICIHSAVSISKSVFIGCINSDHMSRSRHKECHHNHKNHSSRSFHYNN